MSLLATAFGTKVAIAALSLVAIGGGTAVAAANGALPTLPVSVQTEDPTATPTPDGTDTATPNPDPTGTPTSTPSPSATKGPDATGPAAFGLCTAYTAGGLHNTSVAYAALLKASQSVGSIAAYCAPILAAHSHGPSGTPTPVPNAVTVHGKSGSTHGNESSGSHGH